MAKIEDTIQLSILLIDDDQDGQRTLQQFLDVRSHRVFVANNGAEGLEILQRESVDIVITDLMMPKLDGFEVLKAVRNQAPDVEVIIITGHGDMDGAVRALREGAFDFFTKPIDMQGLTATLERTARFHALRLEKNRYRDQLADLRSEIQGAYGLDAIVGNSAAIRSVKKQIIEVAETQATTVLIYGETGTGKELVARAIHHESQRSEGPFVTVDCTSVPESLAESELFGHVKGAFTDAKESRKGRIAQADGGTLFLDEVGDMPGLLQARFLRVLEERQIVPLGGIKETSIDVRVISATNLDLKQAVSNKTFRQDLFYRLNTMEIHVPSLRERREDIPILAQCFLLRFASELRKSVVDFDADALDFLLQHDFPGNVRELRNLVERAVISCKNQSVGISDIHLERSIAGSSVANDDVDLSILNIEKLDDLKLEVFEEQAIREALRRSRGNQNRAAELLGISRFTIKRRIDRYGIM